MTKFFEDEIGEIKIDESDEGNPDLSIVIANSDDFGSNSDVKRLLGEFRNSLISGKTLSDKFICKAENDSDIDCEATFEKEISDIKLKNIVARYEDLDRINVYTDRVEKSDGELIL